MLVFLFTDLESSTRLWETYPETMGADLARHDRILEAGVEAHGGSVVKTTGDGMLATFGDVDSSLEACVEIQRSLAAEAWETPEPLRVRIGVHVGEAEARAGDFYGTAVNRAARIMDAGHGGQVLVSSAAIGVLAERSFDLVDLGPHRLKDLSDPEQLHQLVAPGLERDFPPLATLAGTPNNLPVQVSEFIGRVEALRAATELLERPTVRLLTLVGPGGTGKTRLALQLAAESLERYPEGVFFVDLSDEREPDGGFEAIVRELGLTGAREGTPLQVLRAKLREGHRLLVLDNLEQVTGIGAGVAELLATCPGLEVVGTSREMLALRGEQAFPVPTLGVPEVGDEADTVAGCEAIRLFVERARAVRPDFALDGTNTDAVAEITRTLDGLPLAIELAAARLQLFGAGELADRIRERIDVLGRGNRDVPARQQTLHGAVEWSYELLDDQECRLFEALSVFPSARLDEIEAVVGRVHPGVDVLGSLGSLVAKSLVRRVDDGGSRFSMIRVIREYAAGRLAADPETRAAVSEAHARVYADLAVEAAPRLGSAGAGEVPPEVLAEIGNVQLAWRHLVAVGDGPALGRLFPVLWAVSESQGWYHAAIELNADVLGVIEQGAGADDLDEVGTRVRLARSLMAIGGYSPEVQEHFERALELVAADDLRGRGPVLRALATYNMNIGAMDEAGRLGRELIALGTEQGDAAAVAEGHVVLGATTVDLATAIDHLSQAIEVLDAGGGRSRFRQGALPGIIARMASAILLTRAGRTDDAIRHAQDGLAMARALDHPFSLAYALHHASYFWLWLARFEEAAAFADELMTLAGAHDYPVWASLGSIMEGVARTGLGGGSEAVARSIAGLERYEGLATPPIFWMPLQAVRALGLLLADDPGGAREILGQVVGFPGADIVYPEFRMLLGDTRLASGDADSAADDYRLALESARTVGATMIEMAALRRLVELDEAERGDLVAVYQAVADGGETAELAATRVVLGIE